MINLEHFHTLKEIQSLDMGTKGHLSEITKERERIILLQKMQIQKMSLQGEKEEALKTVKTVMHQQERELAETILQLGKAKQRVNQLTSNQEVTSTEKEIQTLQARREQTENKLFEMMEEVETLEIDIKELKNFLQGSVKSMEELQIDVKNNISNHEREVLNNEKRIANLLETVPGALKSKFLTLNQTYRFKSPLTKVLNDVCANCKMTVNRKDQNNIDKALTVECCESCGRIFLPSSIT